MPDYAGEKTLDPTPHRRQQARREGHVAKSHDLGSAGLLLAGLAVVVMLGGGLVGFLVEYCRAQLGGQPWLAADPGFAINQWNTTLWALARYLLPILGALCLAGVAVNVLQVGFLFLPQRLALDAARLDPLAGLQRIFSGRSMIHLVFGIGKLLVVLGIACVALYGQRMAILELSNMAPGAIAVHMGRILFGVALKIGAALLVLAILDYAYQWWRHEQDLKMTPQELREELRNLEGNPQLIARRKQVRRDLVLERLSGVVSQANVVLTNPSQLAVAVRYDPATMSAPIVVAKGAGASAAHIRQMAAEHGVPTIEQKQLARALFRRVDPNQPVPADQFVPVAEVLTQVAARRR